MIRYPDWEDRLAAYLEGVSGKPFAWGKLDCALFAAGAILAQTGVDPAASFRGRYRSQASAFRAVKRAGFDSVRAVLSSMTPEIPPAFARRGDIVADGNGSLGVCIGQDALFVGEEEGVAGFVRLPLAQWSTAWRIEFGD